MTSSPPAEKQYFTVLLDQAKADLAARGQPIYDFGVGDPIEPTPPFIRQALIDALDPISQYPTVVGQRRLRQSIAGWSKRRLGVGLDPDTQLLPASGSQAGLLPMPLSVASPPVTRRHTAFPWASCP